MIEKLKLKDLLFVKGLFSIIGIIIGISAIVIIIISGLNHTTFDLVSTNREFVNPNSHLTWFTLFLILSFFFSACYSIRKSFQLEELKRQVK